MARLGHSVAAIATATALTALLAGCSGSGGEGASSSLVTGSIFSSAPKTPPKVDEPAGRPMKVAMVSAAAVKCGFYFDPGKLRSSFIAAQTTSVPGTEPAKVTQAYDASYARTSSALAPTADFCTTSEVAAIKSDLNRHLGGDYTTVARVDKGPKPMSTWDWLVDGGQKADSGKLDPNAVLFPSGGAQTTMDRK